MSNNLVVKRKTQVFLPIKIELNPTQKQYKKISQFAGCSNKVYNYWLNEKNEFYNSYIILNHNSFPEYAEYQKLKNQETKNLSKEEKKVRKQKLKELEPKYKEAKEIDSKLWKNCYHFTLASELKEKFLYLKDCDSQVLANAQQNLNSAYSNFYAGRVELPKFKSRKNKRNFKTCMPSKKCLNWNEHALQYPKIGKINFKNKQAPKWYKYKISDPKNISVSILPNGRVFATVLFEVSEYQNEKSSEISESQAIGLDFDLHDMFIDSNGKSAKNDFGYQTWKQNSKKLRHLQRKLSRAKSVGYWCDESGKKHSIYGKNREQLRKQVANEEWHIANCRTDWQEKMSLELVRNYKLIGIEDLSISGMKKVNQKTEDGKKKRRKHSNSHNYEDTSWSSFVSKLQWKSRLCDCQVVKVGKWYPSSQTCHCCGFKYPLVAKKHLENWTCPECGSTHQRDKNAAINIRNEALKVLREAEESSEKSEGLSKDTNSSQQDVSIFAELALAFSKWSRYEKQSELL